MATHSRRVHAPRPAAESACQHAGSHDAILEAEHESAIEQRRPAAPRGATPPNALRDDGKAASDDGGNEILFGSFTSGGSTTTTSTAMTDAKSTPVHATDANSTPVHDDHTPPAAGDVPLLWDE